MTIDWIVAATVAGPIVGGVVAVLFERFLADRPKLVAYVTWSSAITVQPATGAALTVHTHTVVVRNNGRKPAHNVRLRHNILPDYSVFPIVQHTVENLQGGVKEIVFPILRQKEQVSISYLYLAPLLWNQVSGTCVSDEGPAKVLTVFPTPAPPPWLIRILTGLIIIGAITLVYLAVEFVRWLVVLNS